MSCEQAAATLGCRVGTPAREVRAAYRRVVHAGRPDLGNADGAWLSAVQEARDVLVACARPDRRRRERSTGASRAFIPMRRSTWLPDARPRSELDLRL